jgi:hypothetical protein
VEGDHVTGRLNLDCGSMAIPDDWESKPSATLAMPAEDLSLKLPGKAAEAKGPQPNIVVTVTEGSSSADEALGTMLEALTSALPSLEQGESEDVAFDDGGEGKACRVTFPAGNMHIAQLHVMRQAAGKVVHICATAPADREADLEALRGVARSYQPPA